MPGEDYQSWSAVAADNGTADSLINWQEGQTRASVNNSSRSELAAHAKNRNLLNGSIVTTGSANAQAFLSGVTYTSIPTGLIVKLKIGAGLTNTGSTTLNMDGIGATLIKTADGVNLLGGELVENAYTDLLYNGTNWIFLYSREFIMDRLLGGSIFIGQQVFATPGTWTYTPTPLTEGVLVEVVGGGGGGSSIAGAPAYYSSAGGGGSGGYSRKTLSAAEIGASQIVTVGAGGASSTAGGASSFGTLCKANGGNSGAGYAGGAGGSISGAVGDITAAGAPGGNGASTTSGTYVGPIGFGGSSIFGGGAPGPNDASGTTGLYTGLAASNYGSGGSGGMDGKVGSVVSGGAGSGGIVIITEYAGRGAPGRDGDPGPQGPIGPTGPSGPGTGDVLRSGTPTTGQIARWTDASHIEGVALSSLVTGFSTGDAKLTLKTTADTGWVMMDDGTIGDASSGASTLASVDCMDLFVLLWNNIPDAWCPVTGGRGASANGDWVAHKSIKLPRQLGRALAIGGAGAGLTSRVLGSYLGEEAHAQTVAELAVHSHSVSTTYPYWIAYTYFTVDPGVTQAVDAWNNQFSQLASAGNTGSGTPFNIMQPTTFWNVMIKL